MRSYFYDFYTGLTSLLIGMATTLKIFFRKKTTQAYPENRATLQISERFRGTLEMPHDADNKHHCVACGLCEMQCPNQCIHVEFESITDEQGRKQKRLLQYHYDLGCCIFCELCVRNCPHQAIRFNNRFEHAVFNKVKLSQILNTPGSELKK